MEAAHSFIAACNNLVFTQQLIENFRGSFFHTIRFRAATNTM